jgi:homoserine dehydrogenase
MLSKMTAEKCDYDAVLAEAQHKGYAEADPTADVGGWDAARKIAILASIAFGTRVTLDDVHVEGITGITAQDIEYAGELGYVIKLLAIANDTDQGIDVRVPGLIAKSHPLAAVQDVFNAIFVKGDAVGETMFYGRGAGEMPTASAVVADIIDVARDIQHGASSRILCTCFDNKPICPIAKTEITLLHPPARGGQAGRAGRHRRRLRGPAGKPQLSNPETQGGPAAEIVLLTYRVSDANMRLALNALGVCRSSAK